MRENMGLYRGKREDNGAWAEGSMVCCKGDLGEYVKIFSNEVRKSPKDSEFDVCQVDPTTIGQFTGLVDKNGVKVFEGDIVEFSDGIFRRMEWCQDKLGFTARCGDPDLTMESLDISDDKSAEVVGNIHDNHALLEATP